MKWSIIFLYKTYHSVTFQRNNAFSIFIIYDSCIYRWSGQKEKNSYNLPLFLANFFRDFDFHQAGFKLSLLIISFPGKSTLSVIKSVHIFCEVMHYVLDTSGKHIGMDDMGLCYCLVSAHIETKCSSINKLLQN